jgi:hypothetical protein
LWLDLMVLPVIACRWDIPHRQRDAFKVHSCVWPTHGSPEHALKGLAAAVAQGCEGDHEQANKSSGRMAVSSARAGNSVG